MWPEGVTLGVNGSSFFLEVRQIVGWTAMANSFFRYLWKTWGGADNRPPALRGLRIGPVDSEIRGRGSK